MSLPEDRGEVGYSPYLWGLSYENIVPVVLGLSVIGSSDAPVATVGLDEVTDFGSRFEPVKSAKSTDVWTTLGQAKLDNTWHTYRRLASFQWVNSDPENSAFVSMTHVNSSGYTDPPGPTGANGPSPPPTPCDGELA